MNFRCRFNRLNQVDTNVHQERRNRFTTASWVSEPVIPSLLEPFEQLLISLLLLSKIDSCFTKHIYPDVIVFYLLKTRRIDRRFDVEFRIPVRSRARSRERIAY